jgi:flavin-dependent dehydrogenase
MGMPQSCDVLIIGAGPAGSSSASLLSRAGFSVVVVEKQKFPRFVIGESLLPHCMDLLQEADLLDAASARGYIIKRGALFLRGKERCDFQFSEQFTKGWDHTWQVPRADFDKTLADTVESRGIPFLWEHEVRAVDFSGPPVVTVADPAGTEAKIRARFVMDASGYGRTLPRLLNLDKPSNFPSRTAVFTHLRGDRRPPGPDTARIWIVMPTTGVWVWIIPFSNGLTSFGIVGNPENHADYPSEPGAALRAAIAQDPHCAERLGGTEFEFPARVLSGYSCSVKSVHGKGFALVGNATEFLDPVFSSGVTLALESANRASKCAIRELHGEAVDWETDYAVPMKNGTNVFRTYVSTWYDGTLPEIFFWPTVSESVKKMICSVLAGYVWDETNPFVAQHDRKVAQLTRLIQESKQGMAS